MVIFETERLVLRPWTQADADVERLFEIYSRWEVARWLGSVPKPLENLDQARTVVQRWAERCEPDGRLGVWATLVRDTGVIAGTTLLVELPATAPRSGAGLPLSAQWADGTHEGAVEVGWHFHPDSWGNGYATEAAQGALAHGFARGLSEIYAVVRPDNDPSLAVCRRLGMTPLGRTDRWYGTELEAFVRVAGE